MTVYQSIIRNKSCAQLKKIKKKLQRLFKRYDLEIIVESNQKIVNYLDVTLNLKDGTFRRYYKLDGKIKYIIHKTITRQILSNTKVDHQTYALLKSYSKDQQQTTKIITIIWIK